MKTLSIPQPVSCLTAIGQVVSRNAAVWTLVEECNPVTMGEALFLIIVAHNFAHRVEGSGDQEYNQRAIEKVRSALHSVANFMSAQGVKSDPLVREYFMPPCNDPRVQGKEREAFLSGDRTEDLARDVFAKLASRKNGGRS
jgi:hypothetical protein